MKQCNGEAVVKLEVSAVISLEGLRKTTKYVMLTGFWGEVRSYNLPNAKQ
jgi:hypothetical protein